MTDSLRETPLAARHRALGARMVPFSGWEMPVSYAGILAEHRAVRDAAGLFDIAHMGVVRVDGPRALETLQHLTTNDASKLVPGRAQYSLLCREDGKILDDIIVYRASEDRYLVVVNAGNRDTDLAWMQEHATGARPEAEPETALLALQGPRSAAILARLAGAGIEALPYFGIGAATIAGHAGFVARTGYTGEDGFELFVPAAEAASIWDALLDAGAADGLAPCGLGARDTLRLEMAYPLYGHEIDLATGPLEAGLGWVVKPKKGPFIGRDAIEASRAAGLTRKLVGFEVTDRGIPRDGYAILDPAGERIGHVTSGTSSPSLSKGIGLGYVPTALATPDTEIAIDVRGRAVAARVVPTPFVPPHTRR